MHYPPGKREKTGGTVWGFPGDEQELPARILGFVEEALFPDNNAAGAE
jgi:hypothetical protein